MSKATQSNWASMMIHIFEVGVGAGSGVGRGGGFGKGKKAACISFLEAKKIFQAGNFAALNGGPD